MKIKSFISYKENFKNEFSFFSSFFFFFWLRSMIYDIHRELKSRKFKLLGKLVIQHGIET